ncbi:hypothetical protein AAW00_06450 [Aurantiacibacter luteus]|uniref:Uncharacterized protein n=2 Tax=Aurantiacibacter luteus TaxID=1581420 RepID=A0A0G9MZT4_9SPHN|nr:hypothetical protein AAW00_06450 [Aurantiacibacter luteus]
MMKRKVEAMREFRRTMAWIIILAVIVVIGALVFLGSMGELHLHMVVATILGVFISMLLGCGLFALAFFSDKSGHDDVVTDASNSRDLSRNGTD